MQKKTKKTVLITGAASGFGSYLARAFAGEGFDIVINGRNEDNRLITLNNELSLIKGVKCSTIAADIRDNNGLKMLKDILQECKVDILINNSGINPELSSGGITTKIEDINNILLTNTSAIIALCNSAFEHFITRGGGIIININSVAGLNGSSHEAVYAASKFGLRGFSESVKDVWLKKGVRIIDIYPGAIATGMSSNRLDMNSLINPQELANFLVQICMTNSFFVREASIQRTKI